MSSVQQSSQIINCECCKYQSLAQILIDIHYMQNHATIEERKKYYKFYCDQCDYGTRAEITYKIHCITKHDIKDQI